MIIHFLFVERVVLQKIPPSPWSTECAARARENRISQSRISTAFAASSTIAASASTAATSAVARGGGVEDLVAMMDASKEVSEESVDKEDVRKMCVLYALTYAHFPPLTPYVHLTSY